MNTKEATTKVPLMVWARIWGTVHLENDKYIQKFIPEWKTEAEVRMALYRTEAAARSAAEELGGIAMEVNATSLREQFGYLGPWKTEVGALGRNPDPGELSELKSRQRGICTLVLVLGDDAPPIVFPDHDWSVPYSPSTESLAYMHALEAALDVDLGIFARWMTSEEFEAQQEESQ